MTVSVIVCSHNPRAEYLARVLNALRSQTLAEWELLLIDNRSDEPIADAHDIAWHPRAKHVREDKLGLAFARARGIAEAAGDLLVFVDDDNVLPPDYLGEAVRISTLWPQLGAFGGSASPEFEIAPAPELGPYLHMLALRDVTAAQWSNVPSCSDAIPWGAGMCVRRKVAVAYADHLKSATLKLSDRTGKSLLSGGDDEFTYIACGMGFGVGVFPDLKLIHLIGKGRLSAEYLTRLARAMKVSRMLLAYKWYSIEARSPLRPRRLASFLYDLVGLSGLPRRMRIADFLAEFDARKIIRASTNSS